MTLKKKTCALIALIILFSCNSKKDYFFDRINQIEKKIDKKVLKEFSTEKDEKKAITFVYMNSNLAFRDEINKIKKDKKLLSFFKSKGINEYEEIYTIIFTSLHRKINNKDIELDKQITFFINLRKDLLKCEEWQKKNFINNNKFQKGDTIILRLRIQDNSCKRAFDCSNMDPKWEMNDKKDLLITGVIRDKYFYKSVPNINYMKIKILKFNKNNVEIYGNFYKVGNLFEIVLNYDIVEKSN